MNPYILLGLLVFWLASVTGAWFKGSQHAQDAARAQYATDLEKAIAKHEEDAAIDMQAAREAGQAEAKARVKTVTVTNTVERILHEKPAPANCRVTDDTFKLLAAAVQIANGADPDATKPVRDSRDPAGKPR
jgi:hypothetical protein